VTSPGVPVSPGLPLLEGPARDAIGMARSRVEALTRAQLPFPVKTLTEEEKAGALRDAATAACRSCAAIHPGASTAACPRLATFKLNGDFDVIEGSFWPSGATETVVTTDGSGKVLSVTQTSRSDWDTARVIFIEDVAEEEDGGDGAHPA
jgi:hypothetical protein